MSQSDPSVGISVSAIPLGQVIPVFFTLVFVVWLIYTLIASYHWLRYSDKLVVGFAAIGTHLAVSSLLAVYAVSGLQ